MVRPTSTRRWSLGGDGNAQVFGVMGLACRAPSFVPRRLAVSLLGYAGTVQIEAVPTGGQQS